MKNILAEIVAHKKIEVAARKEERSEEVLRQSSAFNRQPFSLREFLQRPDKTGIIAEFKRRSPSKGLINGEATVEAVTGAYCRYGASGLSVLTDEQYFGGSSADLIAARSINQIPILRKDFVIDEYQILEAKAIGADVILLIAECLEAAEVARLAKFADSLGLEVLLEVHSEPQLEKITAHTHLVGVNNRDLITFKVDFNRSCELAPKIPADKVKVAESGISDPAAIVTLKQAGFQGFLIGECFMKESDPAYAFEQFVTTLNALQQKI
ncbi:indole-3-glycerol phosphate synthase [Chitinophaga terrae (ex Kim and Jung 2007)]|uniref:Indole-3-glycerol phosphate synthase n=1 Tax=Chitinophaga terrae (ex Kim and Jung 2007) TaxID=408074 RepID=A0A1H3ZZ64_9BACT|nr:indole-3-glycerol phosphate synthase TrpC [Chitinophaga terrae (ex Kim and Jung 2007)]MDQ0106108.1 indole-3-glycerol phosphate synthase [Chitinophaga terrae (ex Kim and Jung 2007)]GEP89967.1 indole-3-glycerol phosphate synthase [Chitinophaga terrae (ex Kim and Jung 2007)]SEA29169.1 indole-3-glycerol phosphate synthase [Chitinophaga terrae (ex Kim and Jung 2007)]